MDKTNPVIDAIYARRSIRRFLDKPVPREQIKKLLSAAVMSPSAMNRQPWKFVVIENKEKIKELSRHVKKQMGLLGYGLRFTEIVKSKDDTVFYGAPLLILVSAEKNDQWSRINCGILAQTLFLAAHSLGLGSCYIGFANSLNGDASVLADLSIPKDHEIIGALIFGYPSEKKDAPAREPRVIKWIE
ncbi:MAG: nitroreductase family protein [Candidatus Altiarchaeia archaeon]